MPASFAVLKKLRSLLERVGPACDLHVIHGNEVVDEDGEQVAFTEGVRREERAKLIAESHNAMSELLDLAGEALRLRAVVQVRKEHIEAGVCRDEGEELDAINFALGDKR